MADALPPPRVPWGPVAFVLDGPRKVREPTGSGIWRTGSGAWGAGSGRFTCVPVVANDETPDERRKKRRGTHRELQPVYPNAGLTALYAGKLQAFVYEMNRDVVRTLRAVFSRNTPLVATLATDALPSRELQDAMRELAKKWGKRINDAAPELAEYFSRDIQDRSDRALRRILERAGFSVTFKMTAGMRDVVNATTQANVSLIKSIPSQYLTDVEGLVMRSVQTGRDLGTLSRELRHRYDLTHKRAALIARDQNNKATAAMNRTRRLELGITQARWRHSGGGKTPRPDHVAFSQGNDGGPYFDVRKGAFISGEWIQPGELINCRCVAIAVMPWDVIRLAA